MISSLSEKSSSITNRHNAIEEMSIELHELRAIERKKSELFDERIAQESIDDLDGWSRNIVRLEGVDFPITFRGKSELPDLGSTEYVVCSLTPSYATLDTDILTTDALKAWNATRFNPITDKTNTHPDVLVEYALESAVQDNKEVLLSVDATPLGLCQLLRAVKDMYSADFFADDVIDLLDFTNEDDIIGHAAAQNLLIDMLASGYNNRYEPHKNALAVVLASRFGRPSERHLAREVLEMRRKILNLETHVEYMLDRGLRSLHDIETNIDLDKEAMERESSGLVWVHKNKSKLTPNDTINPLKAFNKMSSRTSIHGALNHLVDNPMARHGIAAEGIDLNTTVIAPLSSLIGENDKPTSLFGVDTYWDRESGVTIPSDAVLIHQGESSEGKLSEREIAIPSVLSLNDAKVFMEQILDKKKWITKGAADTYRRKLENEGYDYKTVVVKMHNFDDIFKRQAIYSLEGAPALKNYADTVYEIVSHMAIRACGGEVVRPDGMSAYIETTGFDARVSDIARRSGVLTGLHAYHRSSPSNGYEEVIGRMRQAVFEYTTGPQDRVEITASHPEKLDSEELWTKVAGSPDKALEWLMGGWLSFEQYRSNSGSFKAEQSKYNVQF